VASTHGTLTALRLPPRGVEVLVRVNGRDRWRQGVGRSHSRTWPRSLGAIWMLGRSRMRVGSTAVLITHSGSPGSPHQPTGCGVSGRGRRRLLRAYICDSPRTWRRQELETGDSSGGTIRSRMDCRGDARIENRTPLWAESLLAASLNATGSGIRKRWAASRSPDCRAGHHRRLHDGITRS